MIMLYDRSTSALNTSVGKATTATEKELATKLVNDINGVKSVKNIMTVE